MSEVGDARKRRMEAEPGYVTPGWRGEELRPVDGGQVEALADSLREPLRGMPHEHRAHVAAALEPVLADVWDEGYYRGVRDAEADLDPADNPYRAEGGDDA